MGKTKIYSLEQQYFSLDSNFIFSNYSGQVSDFRTKFQVVKFDLITKFWFKVNSGQVFKLSHAAKTHETKKQSIQREGTWWRTPIHQKPQFSWFDGGLHYFQCNEQEKFMVERARSSVDDGLLFTKNPIFRGLMGGGLHYTQCNEQEKFMIERARSSVPTFWEIFDNVR